jgi:lipid-A-disaccharide synthase
MANLVDRLLVIFPFETESYADTGLRVDYVGHPLIDRLEEVQRQGPEELPWPGTVPIALLPGSRTQEIAAILPLMLDAAQKIESMTPEAGFLVAAGDAAAAEQIDSVSARHATSPSCIEVVTGKTGEVLRQARAAWVASGTANLEAALFDCPHSVVYRTSPWLYALAWLIVEVDHIGIVNLVAGEEICRELIQSKATAHTLTQAMVPLLDDTPQRRAMLDAFHDIRERLGPVGAIGRVADILVEELNADG